MTHQRHTLIICDANDNIGDNDNIGNNNIGDDKGILEGDTPASHSDHL